MPIFGYICSKCGAEFEVWEPCKEDGDDPHCPKCGTMKPDTHTYRICRYWKQAYGGGSTKSQFIRPGSWA